MKEQLSGVFKKTTMLTTDRIINRTAQQNTLEDKKMLNKQRN